MMMSMMLKAGQQLPSSVSNLLHWEIALFTAGPSTQLSGGRGGTYSLHRKYAKHAEDQDVPKKTEGI